MARPTLLVDMMSQPSRALVIFARVNKIPIDIKIVNLGKGEHRTAEYKALNPLGKVPCLVDKEGTIVESTAILRYLARSAEVPDHWYPVEFRARAWVDGALDWYHTMVRWGAARLCWHRVVCKVMGKEPSEDGAREAKMKLGDALDQMESYWLQGGARRFIGGEKPCLADLSAACELEQLHMLVGATPMQPGESFAEIVGSRPRVAEWMADVRSHLAPHYEDAHGVLRKGAVAAARRAGNPPPQPP